MKRFIFHSGFNKTNFLWMKTYDLYKNSSKFNKPYYRGFLQKGKWRLNKADN